jgi:hypothetical protein
LLKWKRREAASRGGAKLPLLQFPTDNSAIKIFLFHVSVVVAFRTTCYLLLWNIRLSQTLNIITIPIYVEDYQLITSSLSFPFTTNCYENHCTPPISVIFHKPIDTHCCYNIKTPLFFNSSTIPVRKVLTLHQLCKWMIILDRRTLLIVSTATPWL